MRSFKIRSEIKGRHGGCQCEDLETPHNVWKFPPLYTSLVPKNFSPNGMKPGGA